MLQGISLLNRLESRENIYITPIKYLEKCNLVFLIMFFLAIISDLFIVFFFGKSFLTIGLVALVSFLTMGIILYLRSHIKSTYVTGDTLIFKSFDNSSKVTSLRSVQKVKTKSMLGLALTRLEYNLDGTSNSVLFINPGSSKFSSPDRVLTEAIDWSKKRKANHKPGPVAV